MNLLMLPHTHYKTTCLSDISSHCLVAYTCQDVCIQQSHAEKRLLP